MQGTKNKPEGINFDAKKLNKLKAEYNEAKQLDRDSFIFEGSVLVTDYAKYLIEHIASII